MLLKILQNVAEATGEMIGNKEARSSRNKAQKEDDRIKEETQEIYIPPEKREELIRDLKLI